MHGAHGIVLGPLTRGHLSHYKSVHGHGHGHVHVHAALGSSYLGLLQVALVKNLLNYFLLILRVEFGSENVLGGGVKLTLGAVS